MKNLFCCILPLSVLVICANIPLSLAATDHNIQTKSEGWIASGKKLLGPSWSKNPKKFDVVPSPLLYQVTAEYSYSKEDGNVDAEQHRGSAELILRKDLLTSVTRYKVNKKETKKALTGVSVNVESEKFFQALRYSITDWMQVVGGGDWTIIDTAKSLDSRSTVFAGALFDVIERPDFSLWIGGFYGYTDEAYKNSTITDKPKYADFTSVDDYSSDNFYLKQNLRWNISDTVTFKEQLDFVQTLKESDYYFWTLDLELDFKLTKYMSFNISYTMDYDYSSFTEAVENYFDERRLAGKPAGEMYEMDTTLAAGIKISF
ncbi:hypothetical protein GKODMF_06245 [Candidatus Electrothrix gigas]